MRTLYLVAFLVATFTSITAQVNYDQQIIDDFTSIVTYRGISCDDVDYEIHHQVKRPNDEVYFDLDGARVALTTNMMGEPQLAYYFDDFDEDYHVRITLRYSMGWYIVSTTDYPLNAQRYENFDFAYEDFVGKVLDIVHDGMD